VSPLGQSHRVQVHEPQVHGNEARFSWSVTPETELYERCDFTLSFPVEFDLGTVPRSLWWRMAIVCLHPQWAILRPCRVELPISLGAREREFWVRLIDNAAVQLEAYGSAPRPRRSVQLVDEGPPLAPERLRVDPERAAVAFSGGKDSMVLAALLAELTERPLLVMSSSPVGWVGDHSGAARERLQREIATRLPVELVEVRSDYRTSWDPRFSLRDGCRLQVHELSDLPVFQAATIIAAAVRGVGRAFMASEADIQYNAPGPAGVVLHSEFASCAVSQGALDALMRPFGIRQGSLSYPLHMPQVQALLLHRYPQLIDLQLSCWQAPEGTRSCGGCPKCFQIALVALSEGFDPRRLGIDPVSVLCAYGDWSLASPAQHGQPPLHPTRSARHHVVRCLQQMPTDVVAAALAGDSRRPRDPRLGEAIAVYARLRANALALHVPPAPGYIGGLLELVEPQLRGRLRAIFDEYFEPAAPEEFAEILARSRGLTEWIVEPLECQPDRPGRGDMGRVA